MMSGVIELASRMGMCPDRLEHALGLLDYEVECGEIPGAVAAIGRNGAVLEYATRAGLSEEAADPPPARTDLLYDCASLTKVVVTLPLVLMLLEEGQLLLEDPATRFIPELEEYGKGALTVRHLLTHTAGFASYADMHSHGWSSEQILDFVIRQPLKVDPGTQVVYSDMGYILLGLLASRIYGEPLEELAKGKLFDPLGMKDACFNPPAHLQPRIAPTEWYPGEDAPRLGRVHDENALALGGVSGHAGLFATAGDLSRYASMWLGEGANGVRVLSPATIRAALRCQTSGIPGGRRGLGWVLPGDPFCCAGSLLSLSSYSHTGFTGTSMVVDPESRLTVVLLTNRVHFGREKSVTRLRQCFHNAVAASVLE